MDNLNTFKETGERSKMFTGRDEELGEIASFIKGNQSVAIIGPRGIGKTALMLHLLRDETAAHLGLDGNLLAYLDCKIFSTCPQEAILAGLCAGMAAALQDKGLAPEAALAACAAAPSWMGFESALRKLNQRGLRVVLMLDEFEQITRNAHVDVRFYNGMRSLAGRLKLSLLTSSACPLVELTCFQRPEEILSSPFFNIFSQLFLGLMPECEARLLVRTTIESAGKVISAQLEQFIYQLAGGHPLALMVACFYACDRPDDRNKIESRTRQELAGFFERDWDNLSEDERDALLHLPEFRAQAAGKPEMRRVLRDLARKCLVVEAGGSYAYPSKAWAEFVSGSKTFAGP